MNAFILTDIEGVAGVVSFEDQSFSSGKGFEQAKRLATEEVNAAVEGLVQSGVDDILIADMHGPGGLNYELLHPAARILHGRPLAPQAVRDALMPDYDIALILGQHAMAGVEDGNLSHTQSSATVEYYKLNDRPIGELAQFALYAGAFDIPLIFLSGDKAACREAEALVPGITTAAVKQGLSLHSAISLAPARARKLIGGCVRDAVARQKSDPIAPLKWPGPYVLEKRFYKTGLAGSRVGPGIEHVDRRTIRLHADNILDIIYA